MRGELEVARLDNLALLRSLDRLLLAQDQPPELRAIFELDADYAEALWALDQPPADLQFGMVVHDTRRSLGAFDQTYERFLATLEADDRAVLMSFASELRERLDPAEAYNDVPGRDPNAGS